MRFDLQPNLENDLLILRPLKEEDFESLYQVASDPLIWEQHPMKNRSERDGFKVFFEEAIASGGAFVIIDKKTETIIGSTRFNQVKAVSNAVEIGWTFLARQYWGGHYNQSMKKLLMDYAFDFVENIVFYINEYNFRSQKAVEKLGGERITHIENKLLETKVHSSFMYLITKNQVKVK
jgi:RimJ/RimL family protein N-acetyltransferase